VSKLLGSGYVLMDAEATPEKKATVRSAAATVAAVPTLTVPAVVDHNHSEQEQGSTRESDLFPLASNDAEAGSPPPLADSGEVTASQRRVRTPEEIMGDLKRRQEEDRVKMDLRYKEKIFKASQRLKSLPQKRSDALAMLDGLRQSIRGSTGNLFMTDDEADSFIHKAVESACIPTNTALLNALRPFAEGQDSDDLRVEAIAAVSLAEAH
jgi:hypothetical protein